MAEGETSFSTGRLTRTLEIPYYVRYCQASPSKDVLYSEYHKVKTYFASLLNSLGASALYRQLLVDVAGEIVFAELWHQDLRYGYVI